MRHIRILAAFFLSGVLAAPGLLPAQPSGPAWKELMPGFEIVQTHLPAAATQPETGDSAPASVQPSGVGTGTEARNAPGPARLIILRIDPERYDFTLHMASEDEALSLPARAERHGLLAAVNAGMYLPDQLTSTGYMKSATHVNNARVAGKFGAFFVAGPLRKGLPRAALLDRNADGWESALEGYALVIQNFRLSDTQGNVLWPDAGPAHSIAVLGQDGDGRILFLFGQDPVAPGVFARGVLDLPLGIRSLMYLEGGGPAAMLVRAGDTDALWSGSRLGNLLGVNGAGGTVVPNILGVVPR